MVQQQRFPKRHYEGDVEPTSCGSGSREVLEVIKTLEAAGIPACIVGIHALVYFGAGRAAHVSHSYFTCPIVTSRD